MAVGHSMGGMLATRFTTQYPDSVERLIIYNPIGLSDNRFNRPMTPVDQIYERILRTDYQSTRRSLSRYVGHDPSAWNDKFELYTRIRSSWTLSSDFPRLAMVQAIIRSECRCWPTPSRTETVAPCSFPGWVMCRTWSGRTSSCPRSSNT